MEHTLLVGDFLLVNKQILAPCGRSEQPGDASGADGFAVSRSPQRGAHCGVSPSPSAAADQARGVASPGDRIRMEDGRVEVNEVPLDEPYVAFEPAVANPFRDNFPARVYTDPNINPDWWRQMQKLTQNGELVVPPGMYFMLGDNRNHSEDSRFWGLVPRQAIIARPLVIYFSLERPSTTVMLNRRRMR